MFDFSFAELALIVVVMVVFIGPKEMPAVVRAIVKAMRSVKALGHEVRGAFDELSRESGLTDITGDIEREVKMIKGDDGKFYESYDMAALKNPVPPPDVKHE